jgi:hypothetical protein
LPQLIGEGGGPLLGCVEFCVHQTLKLGELIGGERLPSVSGRPPPGHQFREPPLLCEIEKAIGAHRANYNEDGRLIFRHLRRQGVQGFARRGALRPLIARRGSVHESAITKDWGNRNFGHLRVD